MQKLHNAFVEVLIQGAAPIIHAGWAQLLFRIQDQRALLRDGYSTASGGDQEKPCALIPGPHVDEITLSKDQHFAGKASAWIRGGVFTLELIPLEQGVQFMQPACPPPRCF